MSYGRLANVELLELVYTDMRGIADLHDRRRRLFMDENIVNYKTGT